MKVLVTGGLGFIGSQLVLRLAESDAAAIHVTVLDQPGIPIPGPLETLRERGTCSVVRGSVLDRDLVTRLVANADEVYHLAAIVGVRSVLRHPDEVIRVNFLGACHVIDAAAKRSTPLLLVSSSEVAGLYRGAPFAEDEERLVGATSELRWSYAGAKALAEQYSLAMHAQGGLPVVCVRPFNVVGPGQRYENGMVIPTFFRQALSGTPVTVIGDGTQQRCFSYVGDVVEAFTRLVREPRARGQVVNVGATEPVTIAELARRICLLTESDSPIRYVSYAEAYGIAPHTLNGRVTDIRFRAPDLSKARALIGYQPKTSLDDILKLFLAHLQSPGG